MSENNSKNKQVLTLERSRSIRLFLYGMTTALLMSVLAGDTRHISFPWGWMVPWVVSTSLGIGIGSLMLIGKHWQKVPLEEKRAVAMSYLFLAYVNIISLMAHMWLVESWIISPWLLAVLFSLLLFLVYWRVYRMEDRKEEIFP